MTSVPPPYEPLPPQYQPYPAGVGPVDPGQGLGIAGLITGFFVSPVGLVLSIVARKQSAQAGFNNGVALAGIWVGAIFTGIGVLGILLWVIAAVAFAGFAGTAIVNEQVEQMQVCSGYEAGDYILDDGTQITCP